MPSRFVLFVCLSSVLPATAIGLGCSGSSDAAAAATGGAGGFGGQGAIGGAGGSAAVAPDAAPVSETEMVDRWASTACSGYGACCGTNGFAFNAAACDTAARAAIASPVCRPGSVYDPAASGECLQGMQTAYASCQNTAPFGSAAAAACGRVCTGTLPLGAACVSSSECAPSADGTVECDIPTGASVCVLYRRGKLGDPCDVTCTLSADGRGMGCWAQPVPISQLDASRTPTNTRCFTNDGLFCDNAGAGTCQRMVAVGAACSDATVCVAGAYCNGAAHVCAAKVTVGGACVGFDACISTAYCASGTCATKKPAGAACSMLDECEGFCNLTTKVCVGVASSGTALNVTPAICGGAFKFN